MLFNSYIFILAFLPITLIGFFCLSTYYSHRAAAIWLTLASIFFYGYWNPAYVPLLLLSMLFNFYVGRSISEAEPKNKAAKLLLALGIFVNLGLIAYYKYAGFLMGSVSGLFGADLIIPKVILPLGISFYTFTQIAYLVDAYRREIQRCDFITYSLFITFFPQLVAGPLLLHSELIPQLRESKIFNFSYENLAKGSTWFCLGLAKKLLIADHLSPWAAFVFDRANEVGFFEAWMGALSYTLQLYFDFSGYSDMAIGLGLMFNVALPLNFNSPYKALSIIDFWRRWHITLSRFLRDYLYIPLGGNRRGQARRYTNLLLTMLLGGLWHGAGWTYVIWGGLHGLFLVVNHAWKKFGFTLPKAIGWGLTFLAVIFSWVFFRAANLNDAITLIGAMLGAKQIIFPSAFARILSGFSGLGIQFSNNIFYQGDYKALLGLIICVVFLPNTQQMMHRFKPNYWWAVGISGLATFSLLSMNRISEFLYFQF